MSEPDVYEDDEINEEARKFMFVNRKAPYGTIYAQELLEVVLISGAYEQDITVVFIDDGVFALKKGQDTKDINMKNFSPTYRALDGYDIEKIYVDKTSMDARGLTPDDMIVDVEIKTSEEIALLMQEQDVIITG